jgi:hypothetical protein
MATTRNPRRTVAPCSTIRAQSRRSLERGLHTLTRTTSRKAGDRKDWRNADDLVVPDAKNDTTAISIRIHTASEDYEVIEVDSLQDDVDARTPQQASRSTISAAKALRICASPEELADLTSRPMAVRDVKPIIVRTPNGTSRMPDVFACEVMNTDMEYVSSDTCHSPTGEMKAMSTQAPTGEPLTTSDVRQLRDQLGLSLPTSAAALLRPNPLASILPDSAVLKVGNQGAEVTRTKTMTDLMEADPAIQCINGISSPRHTQLSPTKMDRFNRLCGRLTSSGDEYPLELGRYSLQMNDSPALPRLRSNDLVPASGESLGRKTQLSRSSQVEGSLERPESKMRLDPMAVEFHSVMPSPKKRQARGKIADIFPQTLLPPVTSNISAPVRELYSVIPFNPAILPSPPLTNSPSPQLAMLSAVPTSPDVRAAEGNGPKLFHHQALQPPAPHNQTRMMQPEPAPVPPSRHAPIGCICGHLPRGCHFPAPLFSTSPPFPARHTAVPLQQRPPPPCQAPGNCQPLAVRPNQISSITLPATDPPLMSTIPPAVPKPNFPVTQKPRDHDPLKQQQYEAYLEWRKMNEPGFAAQCKARQARRAARNGTQFPA